MSRTGRFDVHRNGDRFRTTAPGLDSRHSFSFGPHYDPDNLGFGPLLVSNEDRLDPGAGYDRHAHRGVDIVTWVLAGTLEHEDSTGQRHVLTAGSAQRLRAGSGVHHAEHAADSGESPGAHYVQMWLRSGDPDVAPHYTWWDFGTRLAGGGSPRLVTVASGNTTEGTLTLDQPGAEFLVGCLPAGAEVLVPAAPLVHVFIARGEVRIDATWAADGQHSASADRLLPGDTARLTGARRIELTVNADAEILVWRLAADTPNGHAPNEQ